MQGLDGPEDFVVTSSKVKYSGMALEGGPRIYTVTISGISGEGVLELSVDTVCDVRDLAGNRLKSSATATVILEGKPLPLLGFSGILLLTGMLMLLGAMSLRCRVACQPISNK